MTIYLYEFIIIIYFENNNEPVRFLISEIISFKKYKLRYDFGYVLATLDYSI